MVTRIVKLVLCLVLVFTVMISAMLYGPVGWFAVITVSYYIAYVMTHER